MPILMARTDNRLIHGQVLEAWVPRLGADTILVVDRKLVKDPLQRLVLEGLKRPGLQIYLVTPEQAVELLLGTMGDRRVLLLFPGLRQAREALDAGVPYHHLNLGNIHASNHSHKLTVSVYLTDEDRAQLRYLLQHGVEVEARAVPSDRSPDCAKWIREHE